MLKLVSARQSFVLRLGVWAFCVVATAHAASPDPASDATERFVAQRCAEFTGGPGYVGESNGRAYSEGLLSVFRSHPAKSVGEVYDLIAAKCDATSSAPSAETPGRQTRRNGATEWPNSVPEHLAYFCGDTSADAMTPPGYAKTVFLEVERRMDELGLNMTEAAQDIRAHANCPTRLAIKGKTGETK